MHHCTVSGVKYAVAVSQGKLAWRSGKSEGICFADTSRNPVCCLDCTAYFITSKLLAETLKVSVLGSPLCLLYMR